MALFIRQGQQEMLVAVGVEGTSIVLLAIFK